jgi:hypothetical protein
MAHDVVQGSLPYVHTFDNKPPGIYLIFAAASLLFGPAPFALRIISCLAIAGGSFATYRLVIAATDGRRTMGLVAAYAYVLFTSHLSGLEANTEIFFMPLVAAAFALLWPRSDGDELERDWPRHALAGLLLGIGICIKQSVIYDVAVAAAVVAVFGRRDKSLSNLFVLAVGIALPIALAPLPFLVAGRFALFYQSVVAANVRRIGLSISYGRNAWRILREFATLFPLLELAVLAPFYLRFVRGEDRVFRRTVLIALIWLFVDSAGVLSLGAFESHWILPLLEPLLLLGVVVFLRGAPYVLRYRPSARVWIGALLVAIVIFQAAIPTVFAEDLLVRRLRGNDPKYVDRVSTIVEYLSKRITSRDYVFIVTPESAFEYPLSGAKIPTRFGFSYFLTSPYGRRISGVDPARELRAIFAHRPRYVVLQVPVDSSGLEPYFYDLAGASGKLPLDDPSVAIDAVPWLELVHLAEHDMRGAYARPVAVGGALIFKRIAKRIDGHVRAAK